MSQSKDTLNEWLDYILASHPENVIELGLARMKRMLERLNIAFDCPVITVAGTNGKGSTCAMLESIYRAAGYKTAMSARRSTEGVLRIHSWLKLSLTWRRLVTGCL